MAGASLRWTCCLLMLKRSLERWLKGQGKNPRSYLLQRPACGVGKVFRRNKGCKRRGAQSRGKELRVRGAIEEACGDKAPAGRGSQYASMALIVLLQRQLSWEPPIGGACGAEPVPVFLVALSLALLIASFFVKPGGNAKQQPPLKRLIREEAGRESRERRA